MALLLKLGAAFSDDWGFGSRTSGKLSASGVTENGAGTRLVRS